MHDRSSQLLASVVVPVRDEAETLPGLLEALRRQTIARDRFEVLLGDDGSTDGSTDRIEEDGWVRVFRAPAANAYAARNRAAAGARAPVLAFCDADCRPQPDWLEQGLAALADADVVGGMINWTIAQRSIWSLIEIDTYADQERIVGHGGGLTGNLFVPRELFDRVRGFDDSLPGHGDFDFVERCVASGARLAFARSAVVYHPTHDSARPFLARIVDANRSYAVRQARAGLRTEGINLRSWVPLVQPYRARRRSGRSVRLDRRRLGESGVTPSFVEDAKALPILYVFLPYLGALAKVQGWLRGRRLRGDWSSHARKAPGDNSQAPDCPPVRSA